MLLTIFYSNILYKSKLFYYLNWEINVWAGNDDDWTSSYSKFHYFKKFEKIIHTFLLDKFQSKNIIKFKIINLNNLAEYIKQIGYVQTPANLQPAEQTNSGEWKILSLRETIWPLFKKRGNFSGTVYGFTPGIRPRRHSGGGRFPPCGLYHSQTEHQSIKAKIWG